MTPSPGQAGYSSVQQFKPKGVPAENSYTAILEAVIAALGQMSNKTKILASTLPYALAIGEVELGALLVIGDGTSRQASARGDSKANKLSVVAKHGMPDEVIRQLTTSNLGQPLLTGQRLWVEPQPLQLNAEQALLGRHKLRYLLGIPLQFDGNVLGAIVVGTRQVDDGLLCQEAQQRLTMLAQLVALFLDDVRLRTNSQRQPQEEAALKPVAPSVHPSPAANDLEQLLAAVMSAEEEVVRQNNDLGLLNALSNEVSSSLQLNSIVEAAIKWTRSGLNTDAGWCYLLKDGVLALQEQQGLSERYVAGMQCLAPGNGTEGMAFSRKEPILRDGLLFHSGQARTLVKEEGLRTVAAVPLIVQGQAVGVLAVANHHERIWSTRDQRMLLSIGRQVAQAISNSQRFIEAKEKAQTWEANHSTLQQAT
ncbi:MAG: GAF domain-containing protein [Chloroflexi bacterium]|nr:GAF domain-containing protein [Chloroflexota bacterium]